VCLCEFKTIHFAFFTDDNDNNISRKQPFMLPKEYKSTLHQLLEKSVEDTYQPGFKILPTLKRLENQQKAQKRMHSATMAKKLTPNVPGLTIKLNG